ncbi:hypothetical protein Ae717Ps2_6902 [Pseudonocardia sp. Ae717_Ps2]|nr:hypothetical protein Ae717Ps2_6902 [Pseudonocardia sp. Ae717_Ps2]
MHHLMIFGQGRVWVGASGGPKLGVFLRKRRVVDTTTMQLNTVGGYAAFKTM